MHSLPHVKLLILFPHYLFPESLPPPPSFPKDGKHTHTANEVTSQGNCSRDVGGFVYLPTSRVTKSGCLTHIQHACTRAHACNENYVRRYVNISRVYLTCVLRNVLPFRRNSKVPQAGDASAPAASAFDTRTPQLAHDLNLILML